jgi:hypothetical protein
MKKIFIKDLFLNFVLVACVITMETSILQHIKMSQIRVLAINVLSVFIINIIWWKIEKGENL